MRFKLRLSNKYKIIFLCSLMALISGCIVDLLTNKKNIQFISLDNKITNFEKFMANKKVVSEIDNYRLQYCRKGDCALLFWQNKEDILKIANNRPNKEGINNLLYVFYVRTEKTKYYEFAETKHLYNCNLFQDDKNNCIDQFKINVLLMHFRK